MAVSRLKAAANKTKIICFHQRSKADANGVCLGCHVQDAQISTGQTALTR
jgi:hypothetical protein